MRFNVSWGAVDGGVGLSHYNVQYKVGALGAWQGWLTNTLATSAPFLGALEQTYYFKISATDKVNNTDSEESGPVTVKGVTKYYTLGGQQVAMRQGDVVYYLHGDHLGSTSLTTNQSGAIVAQTRYLPYGQERWTSGATPTDFTFTGQRNEAGFGLMDYNARYYSAVLGRFISPDTVVPKVEDPQHWNRYSYVYNNPLKLTDPTGHIGCTDSGPAEDPVDGGSVPNCGGAHTGGSHDSQGGDGGGAGARKNVGPATEATAGGAGVPKPGTNAGASEPPPGYTIEEWNNRLQTVQKHPLGHCSHCAEDMNKKFDDEIYVITSEYNPKPLNGPTGEPNIGADRGWHMVTKDANGNLWDNFGFQGSADDYIDTMRSQNPGMNIKGPFNNHFAAQDAADRFEFGPYSDLFKELRGGSPY
jgi:RHS repeat-associated protein